MMVFLAPLLNVLLVAGGSVLAINALMALGRAASSKIDNTQKIGQIAEQTAQENIPRLIVFGKVKPVGGNIIACGDPRIWIEHKKIGRVKHRLYIHLKW